MQVTNQLRGGTLTITTIANSDAEGSVNIGMMVGLVVQQVLLVLMLLGCSQLLPPQRRGKHRRV